MKVALLPGLAAAPSPQPVKAITLVVANRPDARGVWPAEVRPIVVVDFYRKAGA